MGAKPRLAVKMTWSQQYGHSTACLIGPECPRGPGVTVQFLERSRKQTPKRSVPAALWRPTALPVSRAHRQDSQVSVVGCWREWLPGKKKP